MNTIPYALRFWFDIVLVTPNKGVNRIKTRKFKLLEPLRVVPAIGVSVVITPHQTPRRVQNVAYQIREGMWNVYLERMKFYTDLEHDRFNCSDLIETMLADGWKEDLPSVETEE